MRNVPVRPRWRCTRCWKLTGYMALGAEVVDLVWLYLFDDPLQVAAVAQVAVMEL